MPIRKNEDGTVTCTPPWSLSELLDIIDYDCEYDFESNTMIFYSKEDSNET